LGHDFVSVIKVKKPYDNTADKKNPQPFFGQQQFIL